MTNFNSLMQAVTNLSQLNLLYQVKPTKADSKRMRLAINSIQKLAVEAKRDLIAADNATK